jgi:hypothetical protein
VDISYTTPCGHNQSRETIGKHLQSRAAIGNEDEQSAANCNHQQSRAAICNQGSHLQSRAAINSNGQFRADIDSHGQQFTAIGSQGHPPTVNASNWQSRTPIRSQGNKGRNHLHHLQSLATMHKHLHLRALISSQLQPSAV